MASLVGAITGAFIALAVSGCASSGTTLVRPGDQGQVIYRISEERAFTIALDAYAALYPKKSVDDVVEGNRRGYNADERRWAGDWWHHRILVVPAIGIDASGNEVHGYWYDYSGGGTFAPTTERTTGLLGTRLPSFEAGCPGHQSGSPASWAGVQVSTEAGNDPSLNPRWTAPSTAFRAEGFSGGR